MRWGARGPSEMSLMTYEVESKTSSCVCYGLMQAVILAPAPPPEGPWLPRHKAFNAEVATKRETVWLIFKLRCRRICLNDCHPSQSSLSISTMPAIS